MGYCAAISQTALQRYVFYLIYLSKKQKIFVGLYFFNYLLISY